MSECFLITTPEHDDTTAYCSKWSSDIIEEAENRGHIVVNLKRESADKKNFENRVRANNPRIIMFNGHGNKRTIAGHMDEKIISCDLGNENLTQNTMVYARSCSSGAELGPSCIKSGCKVFIGYQEVFGFVYDPSRSSVPEKDSVAAHFFRVSNTIPKSLLKGDSAFEAGKKADIQLEKELDYLKTHFTPETPNIIPWLLWNKSARIILSK